MKIVITYCSGPKRKDGGLLPAVDRYLSDRIRTLQVNAARRDCEFRILSGEFGLLAPEQPIPWYDHLLLPEEVSGLVPRVTENLSFLRDELNTNAVEYHTADPARHPELMPYRDTIAAACEQAGIPLQIILLAGNPD